VTKIDQRRDEMRYWVWAFLVLVTAGAFGGGAASAEQVVAEEHCVVNVRSSDVLNVRKDVTGTSALIVKLRYNECGVIVTGQCEGNWCPVEAKNRKGWVQRQFVSVVSPSLYCVTGVASNDELNVRAWPSPQSKVTARLRPDQCDIAFLPYSVEGWQKIRVKGLSGWVKRSFVSGQ
jgi:SH3-like domain-containing protein